MKTPSITPVAIYLQCKETPVPHSSRALLHPPRFGMFKFRANKLKSYLFDYKCEEMFSEVVKREEGAKKEWKTIVERLTAASGPFKRFQ